MRREYLFLREYPFNYLKKVNISPLKHPIIIPQLLLRCRCIYIYPSPVSYFPAVFTSLWISVFVCGRVLSITDLMGDRTVFTGDAHNMTAPSLALQLINPDTPEFHGLTFEVSSLQNDSTPEVRDKERLYI